MRPRPARSTGKAGALADMARARCSASLWGATRLLDRTIAPRRWPVEGDALIVWRDSTPGVASDRGPRPALDQDSASQHAQRALEVRSRDHRHRIGGGGENRDGRAERG